MITDEQIRLLQRAANKTGKTLFAEICRIALVATNEDTRRMARDECAAIWQELSR